MSKKLSDQLREEAGAAAKFCGRWADLMLRAAKELDRRAANRTGAEPSTRCENELKTALPEPDKPAASD